jgi:ACS family hexuronate transporter-like MFS transporter
MTQIVGYVLTKTHNNYAMLFSLIPVMYFIALAWLYLMAPRQVPVVELPTPPNS